MRNLLLILFLFLINPITHAQDTEIKSGAKKVQHYHIIKAGTSVQADFHPYYKEEYYYDGYYYYESYHSPRGAKFTAYLGYECIWEFRNKLAIAIEPKVGFSRLVNGSYFFAGNDFKFYWANKGIWRMGVALSTDYYFGKNDVEFVATLGDGHYQQLINTKMNSHNINIDLGLIPFQFHFKHFPMVIETQFSMIGIGLLFENSEIYKEPNGKSNKYNDFSGYPYMLKPEIKIGIQLP